MVLSSIMGKKKKHIIKLGEQLEPKLDIIEMIRSELRSEHIDIPGIVVAGSQSSGKSSLLESMSGIQLPSGKNITTRVPLILRIEKINPNSTSKMIIHNQANIENGEVITPDSLNHKIIEYTNLLAGDNSEVFDKPIHVKYLQHEIPSMTLIDLPGITHISVNNSQKNIHEKTSELVKQYVKNPNVIILCVVPATDDFANCEAIKIASEVDPDGIRTIGVITKIDISPYDISDKIHSTGNNVKLKLGFIAVKNKNASSQFTSIKDLRKDEKKYFEDNYNDLDSSLWGIETLIKRVVSIQMKFIDSCFPQLIDSVTNKLDQINNELNVYKKSFESDNEKLSYVLKNIIFIQENYKSIITNTPIVTKLFKEYKNNLYDNIPNYTSEHFIENIKHILTNEQAIGLSNFLNIHSFQNIFLDTNLKNIQSFTNSIVDKMKQSCKDILFSLVDENFKLFESMKTFLKTEFDKQINIIYNESKSIVQIILNNESNIFTQTNYYNSLLNDLRQNDNLPSIYKKTGKMQICCDMILSLISYHETVLNRICDTIPMILFQFYKNILIDNISYSIIPNVNKDTLNEIMVEDPTITNKRNNLLNSQERLQNILHNINILDQ